MSRDKIIFVDRDGTLIDEPADEQVDTLEKLVFKKNVIEALKKLQQAGFKLVMVTNQDGLGTDSFPEDRFTIPHNKMLEIFASQGVIFDDVLICPHFASDGCDCRKPLVGLLYAYINNDTFDRDFSYVIGDRETDLQFAKNIGTQAIHYSHQDWLDVAERILNQQRQVNVTRKTNETTISVLLNLDANNISTINTGLGFFDHMLDQIALNAGIYLSVAVAGDLDVDQHHVIEDTAITLGLALKKALNTKHGINRYGFTLPMDEAMTQMAIDLSGRPYCQFKARFTREFIGDVPTEMISHFFQSLATSAEMTLQATVKGENTHHMVESAFKCLGRCLRQAIKQEVDGLPSTKGVL